MIHTVNSLNQLMTSLAEKAFLTTENNPIIVMVEGTVDLKDDKETSFPNHYAFINDVDSSVSIVIPKKFCLQNQIKSGQYVRATGGLEIIKSRKSNNSFDIRLMATDVIQVDSPEKAKSQSEAFESVQKLLSLNATRNPFPLGSNISIHVIVGKTSEVLQDFENAVTSIKHALDINYDFVDITSSLEVTEAIGRATSQVLIIIRGGGLDKQFAVFNQPGVISALSKFKGYRILAVGHTQHRTISDFFCDFTCNTPTAAGYELRDKLLPILALYEKIKSFEVLQAPSETTDVKKDLNPNKTKFLVHIVYIAIILLLITYMWFKK